MDAPDGAGLFGVFTAHCFFTLSGCTHIAQATTPQAVHDAMGRHYETTHRRLIDQLTGRVGPRRETPPKPIDTSI